MDLTVGIACWVFTAAFALAVGLWDLRDRARARRTRQPIG